MGEKNHRLLCARFELEPEVYPEIPAEDEMDIDDSSDGEWPSSGKPS